MNRHSASVARGRWVALAIASLVIAVLGIGWLADGLATTSSGATTGALKQQMGSATVEVIVSRTPLRANRPESLTLRITDTTGAPIAGAHIQCALSMPKMGMELPGGAATPTARPGDYVCPAQTLDAGVWTLALTVALPSGKTDHARFQLTAT